MKTPYLFFWRSMPHLKDGPQVIFKDQSVTSVQNKRIGGMGGWGLVLPQNSIPSLQEMAKMSAAVILTIIRAQVLHPRYPYIRQNMLIKQKKTKNKKQKIKTKTKKDHLNNNWEALCEANVKINNIFGRYLSNPRRITFSIAQLHTWLWLKIYP